MEWYSMVIGKNIDTDNYPRSNPFQCWDLFDFFCRQIGFDGSRKCKLTNYVCDLWKLKDQPEYNYGSVFEYIRPGDLRKGDWLFWDSGSSCPFGHVGMLWEDYGNGYGLVLGQNQGTPNVTTKKEKLDVLGALRWKGWVTVAVPYGKSTLTINNHEYVVYRMSPGEKIAVASKGLNTVATIHDLDLKDKLVYAAITGANFYQREKNKNDPYGTTYGDISSPLCGVYQSLPNQDTTLFYDLETADFGDCSFREVDRTHNVYSPVIIYPNANGHYEYARMVGQSHIDHKSFYSFTVRYDDAYAVGIAMQELTPREIIEDFCRTGMSDIAIGDGGVSAQAKFWDGTKMDYVRDTGSPAASAIMIYRDPLGSTPVQSEEPEIISPAPVIENEENTPETEMHEAMEDDMKDESNVPAVQETKTIPGQIANLIDVKSIMTIILVVTLCHLVITGKALDDKFMTIVTAVVTFYFSYQVKKQ